MKRRDFVAPPEAVAAVFIAPTHCQFQLRNGDKFTSKQVTPSTLRLAFNEEPLDTGWLAPGVVRWGTNPAGCYTVGFYPPARYKFPVRFKKGVRKLHVPLPSLVFAGLGNKYYIWAMKDKTFNPKGQLFNAPLPNLNEHGLICFGSNAHPDVRAGGFGPSWKMVWDSIFTDHHAKGRSRAFPEDVRMHLLKLHTDRAEKFPLTALVPLNVTLDAAVQRLITRDRRQDD